MNQLQSNFVHSLLCKHIKPYKADHLRHKQHPIHKYVSIPIPNHMTYNAKRKYLLRQNENVINHKKIINYSNRPLSKQETDLL